MNKFLKIALWVLIGLAAVILILGLIAPKKFDISRTQYIKADKAKVWEQVSLWKNFPNWSPWNKYDKAMTTKIEGTDGEPGSKYSWASKSMGNGSMTIVESKPMDFRRVDLVFDDWGSKSDVTMMLKDTAGGTNITWRMAGENGFFGSIFSWLMGMDAAIGKDYEEGLSSLKKECEKAPAYKMGEVETKTFPKTIFAAIRHKMKMDDFVVNSEEIFKKSVGQLMEYNAKNKLEMVGTVFGLYYVWDDSSKTVELEIAVPVNKEAPADGDVHITKIGPANCAALDFYGAYKETGNGHYKMDEWLKANNKTSTNPVMEEYVTDPEKEKDPMKVLTRLWYPLK